MTSKNCYFNKDLFFIFFFLYDWERFKGWHSFPVGISMLVILYCFYRTHYALSTKPLRNQLGFYIVSYSSIGALMFQETFKLRSFLLNPASVIILTSHSVALLFFFSLNWNSQLHSAKCVLPSMVSYWQSQISLKYQMAWWRYIFLNTTNWYHHCLHFTMI